MQKLSEDMNPSKSVGLDNLTGKFVRDGASVLAAPISDLCNLSISLSIFPDDCKIAKLKPIHKKESKTEPKNYRPISLLPLISKIMEKVIHNQTKLFLEIIISYININLASENIIPQIHACHILMIKFKLGLSKVG